MTCNQPQPLIPHISRHQPRRGEIQAAIGQGHFEKVECLDDVIDATLDIFGFNRSKQLGEERGFFITFHVVCQSTNRLLDRTGTARTAK